MLILALFFPSVGIVELGFLWFLLDIWGLSFFGLVLREFFFGVVVENCLEARMLDGFDIRRRNLGRLVFGRALYLFYRFQICFV